MLGKLYMMEAKICSMWHISWLIITSIYMFSCPCLSAVNRSDSGYWVQARNLHWLIYTADQSTKQSTNQTPCLYLKAWVEGDYIERKWVYYIQRTQIWHHDGVGCSPVLYLGESGFISRPNPATAASFRKHSFTDRLNVACRPVAE